MKAFLVVIYKFHIEQNQPVRQTEQNQEQEHN